MRGFICCRLGERNRRGETNVFAANCSMYSYETIRQWIGRVMKVQQRRKRKEIRGQQG
jgi:hypothetical protein